MKYFLILLLLILSSCGADEKEIIYVNLAVQMEDQFGGATSGRSLMISADQDILFTCPQNINGEPPGTVDSRCQTSDIGGGQTASTAIIFNSLPTERTYTLTETGFFNSIPCVIQVVDSATLNIVSGPCQEVGRMAILMTVQ